MTSPPRITWRGGQLRAIKTRHLHRYTKNRSYIDPHTVAHARKELIEFVFIYQHFREVSLRQAILVICGRIQERKITPHLVQAVLDANARPNRIGSTTISSKTMFRWVRIYKDANGDPLALAPRQTKTIYANDNKYRPKGPRND